MAIDRDRYLDQAFWDECHVCLENERGKPSLPTVQALFLMYLHECGQGRDATALHYRYLAHDMYMRLKLDHRETKFRTSRFRPSYCEKLEGYLGDHVGPVLA